VGPGDAVPRFLKRNTVSGEIILENTCIYIFIITIFTSINSAGAQIFKSHQLDVCLNSSCVSREFSNDKIICSRLTKTRDGKHCKHGSFFAIERGSHSIQEKEPFRLIKGHILNGAVALLGCRSLFDPATRRGIDSGKIFQEFVVLYMFRQSHGEV